MRHYIVDFNNIKSSFINTRSGNVRN